MFRMYYISTAIQGLTENDYQDILAKARKNNVAQGVTGLLIVKGEFFAQALEGEKENVMALFEKIKQDRRHFRVVIISREDVEERIFSNWEMGFRDIGLSDEFPEVDLGDSRFVNDPTALDRVFRRVVEYEACV